MLKYKNNQLTFREFCMKIVGIQHANKVYFVNADKYHNINDIAKNTKAAMMLGSNGLQLTSNLVDGFSMLSQSFGLPQHQKFNATPAEARAIADSKLFVKDIQAANKNGMHVSIAQFKAYGFDAPFALDKVVSVDDLGGVEIIQGLFGLNLNGYFRAPAPVQPVKASVVKKDGDLEKALKISAAEAREEEALQKALTDVQAQEELSKKNLLQTVHSKLVSIFFNHKADELESDGAAELGAKVLDDLRDACGKQIEQFLGDKSSSDLGDIDRDLVGMDSEAIYEIYAHDIIG
jgi:hypothetical protein